MIELCSKLDPSKGNTTIFIKNTKEYSPIPGIFGEQTLEIKNVATTGYVVPCIFVGGKYFFLNLAVKGMPSFLLENSYR